jgi:Mce-associated membrane protein
MWRIGWACLVVVAGLACWAGLSWWHAGHDDATSRATTRDDVLRAGTQEIAALNTMNPAHLDQGLRLWLDASTGLLHDQLRGSEAQSRQQIEQARSAAAGRVTDAAVTQLNPAAGTAEMIAAVDIQVTPQTGSATTDRNRYRAGLTRTAAGWKLSSLTAIPVGEG